MFTQPFIQKQIKENIKAPRHWPLCGEFTGTGEFPAQRASNTENVSIWWRHHDGFNYLFPASLLFTQPFIQKQIKENIKAPRHWPLCGEVTGTGEFPAQRASYAENVSIWWRHHDKMIQGHLYTFDQNFIFHLPSYPYVKNCIKCNNCINSFVCPHYIQCTRFCYTCFCFGNIMSTSYAKWYRYPYPPELLHRHNITGAWTINDHMIAQDASTATLKYHDDVIKWKHFPRYWPFVRGIHRSPVNSPHKGQWRGALMFTLICARINAWVNNREAGDFRRYRTHSDVIVMFG